MKNLNVKGFVRMPHLRIPKNTRIDYRGYLIRKSPRGESILLTDAELKEVGDKTIEELVEQYANKPVIEHTERFGDISISRNTRRRAWNHYVGEIPDGTYLNHDGEVVRDNEDGREEVLVSRDDLKKHKGLTAMQILEAKAKEQGAMA